MRQADRALAEANHWPILEPIDADGQVNPVALSKPVCVVGARHRVNLPLNSLQISRAHALFVVDGDGVYLRDLASLNGVIVNDTPVRDAAVRQGDVVEIGPFSFRCADHFPTARPAGEPRVEPAELRLPDGATPVPLTGRTLVIGSREQCDLHLSDPEVSPAHAIIFERDGRRFIRDLRSATGTHVNGKRIGAIELEMGDSIQIGATRMTYEAASPASPEPEASGAIPLLDDADAIELMADDSTIAAAEREESIEPRESVGGHAPEDSGIIPLLADEEAVEPASAHPKGSPATEDSSSQASPTPEADDSSLIPLATDSESESAGDARPPSAAEAPDEPEPLADDNDAVADFADDPDLTGVFAAAHPGEVDRPDSDEVFNELLDDLERGVKQAHPGRGDPGRSGPGKGSKKSKRKVR